MNPLFHTELSISDSLKSVRKSVLIYETIIVDGVELLADSVVYQTTKQCGKIIEEHLAKKCNVISCYSDEKFAEIYEEFFLPELEKYSTNGIDEPELYIEDMRFLNPRFEKTDYKLSFYQEFKDLIQPLMNPEEKEDFSEGPYEVEDFVVKERDVVFDCGSNIGLFSITSAAKGAIAYAFEPAEQNSQYIDYAIRQFPENIILVSSTVGEFNGTTKFLCEGNGTGFKITQSTEMSDHIIEVPITTIDSFVEKGGLQK